MIKLPASLLTFATLYLALACFPPARVIGQVAQRTGGKAEPTVLSPGPLGIARKCMATGSEVYWLDDDDRTILHVNREKGRYPMPLLRTNTPIEAFTVEGDAVYYIRQNPIDALEKGEVNWTTADLKKIERSEKLTSVLTFELGNEPRIVTDNDSIYVVAGAMSGKILQISKTSGTIKLLATKILSAVLQLAVDDKNIYWLDPSDKALYLAPKTGGEKTKLFSSEDESFEPETMIADETNFYVMTRLGTIYRVAKANGRASQIYSGGGFEFLGHSMVADRKRLYWTERQKIMTMDKDQLNPIALYSRERPTTCITLDNEFLYWFEDKAGLVKTEISNLK